MSYAKQFVHGDAAGEAYQALVTLSDPEGWTLTAGGPAAAFVAPAAREHGLPQAAAAAAAGALRQMAIGGSPAGGIAPGTPDPITVSRDFVGEVPMEHSDLGRMTIAERIKTNNWSRNNVAVFEYEDAHGQLQHLVKAGLATTRTHSERLALVALKEQGVPFDKVTRIYSELEPCEVDSGGFKGEGCKAMLATHTPQAKITYSYAYKGRYTDTRPVREAALEKRAADFVKYQNPTLS